MFPKNVKNASSTPSAVRVAANAQRKTETIAKATKPFSTPACHFSEHLLQRKNKMGSVWQSHIDINPGGFSIYLLIRYTCGSICAVGTSL